MLTDTTEQALYIRVKVLHPNWTDEAVKREVEKLHSEELAEFWEEFFQRVSKRKVKQ